MFLFSTNLTSTSTYVGESQLNIIFRQANNGFFAGIFYDLLKTPSIGEYGSFTSTTTSLTVKGVDNRSSVTYYWIALC